MNNIEFCNLVREAKKTSGRSNMELIVALRKSQGVISDMLKPRGDYSVSRYILLLEAIGFYISVVNSDGECEKILSEEDLIKWAKNVLAQFNASYYELGEKLDTSHTTIFRILKGGTIRLSIFLKLAELTNSKITLDAIV